MKRSIPALYAEYGRYIDKSRAIPYYIDCLKPVERRLLLTLWSLAKNKNVKAARIVGECLGKFHPHGDQSTYGSLVGLVQRGFAIGQGNWGAVGLENCQPAAMRYPEISSNKILNDLAFEFIKQIPWDDPESLQYEQPRYLPSPIPVGLIGTGIIEGISFHVTKMPRYSITDLVKRLTYLFQSEVDPQTPPVIIKPTFPNCDVYENEPGDFEKILTTGKGSIKVIPKIEVKKDGIHIYGKPPNGFNTLKTNSDNEKKPEQPKYKVIDLTEKNILDILIEPEKKLTQKLVDVIFRIISSNIHFNCNAVDDDGIVKSHSIDVLLKRSYSLWVNSYNNLLNGKIIGLKEHLYELSVIEVVREMLINHNVKTEAELLNLFNKKYIKIYKHINEDAIRAVINKHKIKTLLEFKINIKATQDKINNIQNTINNIDTVAYNKLIKMVPIS